MKYFFLCLLCIATIAATAQPQRPANVTTVLQQAGNNRSELEKALVYFEQQPDTLKKKAAYFLIGNMDIHYSASYYWADKDNRRIPYNELEYKSWEEALAAFDSIKNHTPGIHPVAFKYKDIDSIKASFLVSHIERAFQVRNLSWAKDLPFNDFCEYLLPYRTSIEPLQNGDNAYMEKFAWMSSQQKPVPAIVEELATDYKKWFTNTYGIESRKEPLPRLGAMQLLQRRKGPCEDIAGLTVYALRSQGIAATIDEIPYWATASGRHWMNTAFQPGGAQPFSFDITAPSIQDNKLPREPAKVIRYTYSRQENTLPNFETTENIPEGFLRNYNYIDVTQNYWAVQSVSCQLFTLPASVKTIYACVYNFLDWRAAWWSRPASGAAVFHGMCQGAVYLPMYYNNGKLIPAGYPVIANGQSTTVLQPDTARLRTISIYEQDKYLAFRPGKKYRLFYWDNKWKPIGEAIPNENQKTLEFSNVPQNALLLLIPEYSQRKERPFTISATGERTWW